MKRKTGFFLWTFFFILLTTYSLSSYQLFNLSLFPVKTIKIQGTINSNQDEIKKIFNEYIGKSIILISTNEFRKNIESIKFVKEIKIKKIYPDTINLTIIEYKPVGILINKNEKFIISESGHIIKNFSISKFQNLPIIYGEPNEKNFKFFFKILKQMNFPLNLIHKLNYFDIGRWDIVLKNDKLIKLPKKNYTMSIKKFLSIYEKDNFVNFSVFDFRVKGQLILK